MRGRGLFFSAGNREAPVFAEGFGGDFYARGGLPAFVFIKIHQSRDALDLGFGKSLHLYFVDRQIFFDITQQNRVEQVVRR